MKICIYGAGSVGGILGAHLARVLDVEVSLIARGAIWRLYSATACA